MGARLVVQGGGRSRLVAKAIGNASVALSVCPLPVPVPLRGQGGRMAGEYLSVPLILQTGAGETIVGLAA